MAINPFKSHFNAKQDITLDANRNEKILDARTLLESRGICDTALHILSFNRTPTQSIPEANYEKDKSHHEWASKINSYLSELFSTQTELFLRGSQARQLISPFDQLTHLLQAHIQNETEENQVAILDHWSQYRPHLSNMNPPKDFDWFALACSPVDIQKMHAVKYELKNWMQQEYPDYPIQVLVTRANELNRNPHPFIIIKIGEEFDFVFGLQGCKPALCSLDDHALKIQGNRLIPVSIGESGEEKKRFWQSMLDATFGIIRTDENLKDDFYSCLAFLQHRTNGLELVEEGSDLKSAVEPFLMKAPSSLLSYAIMSRYQNHQVDPWLFVENTLAFVSQDPQKKAQIEQEIRAQDPNLHKQRKSIKATPMEITRSVNQNMAAGHSFIMTEGIEQSVIKKFDTAALLNSAPHFPKLSKPKRYEILKSLNECPAKALLKDERTLKENLLIHASNIGSYTREEQELVSLLFQLYLEQSQARPQEKFLLHKTLLNTKHHFDFASLYKTVAEVNKFDLNLFRGFVSTAISNQSPEDVIEDGIKRFSQLKRDPNARDLGIEQLNLEYFIIKNSEGLQRKNASERQKILKEFLDIKKRLRKIPELLKDDWETFEQQLKK